MYTNMHDISRRIYILQHTNYLQAKYLAMTKTVIRQRTMYNYVAKHNVMLCSAVTANFAALVVSPHHRHRHSLEDDVPDQYSHNHVK